MNVGRTHAVCAKITDRVSLSCIGLLILFAACPDVAADQNPIQVLAPNGGETFRIGDTITILYEANPYAVNSVNILISPDAGITWLEVSDRSFNPVDVEWQQYPWVIPPELPGEDGAAPVSLASAQALVKVKHYNNADVYDVSDDVFAILPASSAIREGFVRRAGGTGVAYAELFDLSGARVASAHMRTGNENELIGNLNTRMPVSRSHGVYVLRVYVNGAMSVRQVGHAYSDWRH